MATIVVEIPDTDGQSTVEGYTDKIDALGISERMFVATAGRGARPRSGRTAGRAGFRDIQLIRHVDIASPKLRQYCSAGTNVGVVKIHLFRSVEEGATVYFTYTLDETFVSRIEVLTADHTGQAYAEHENPRARDRDRLRMMPRFPAAPGIPGNREVEHVWFNAARVWWTCSAEGAVEKSWDIQKGREASGTKPT